MSDPENAFKSENLNRESYHFDSNTQKRLLPTVYEKHRALSSQSLHKIEVQFSDKYKFTDPFFYSLILSVKDDKYIKLKLQNKTKF